MVGQTLSVQKIQRSTKKDPNDRSQDRLATPVAHLLAGFKIDRWRLRFGGLVVASLLQGSMVVGDRREAKLLLLTEELRIGCRNVMVVIQILA